MAEEMNWCKTCSCQFLYSPIDEINIPIVINLLCVSDMRSVNEGRVGTNQEDNTL
jgi:hypothetical protein